MRPLATESFQSLRLYGKYAGIRELDWPRIPRLRYPVFGWFSAVGLEGIWKIPEP